MIFEWTIAFALMISAGFLLGLCLMLFRYYSSRKHRYIAHIAIMAAAEICFTVLLIGQLVSAMFGVAFSGVVTIVLIFLTLWLKIIGLFRLFKHRTDERDITR